MNYDKCRKVIKSALRHSGQEACIAALADIITDMYMSSEEVDDDGQAIYYLYEDKEVSGADLVESVGQSLLEGGLKIPELLTTCAQVVDA